MMTIIKHELKINFRNLMIWALSVGCLGFVCILLYASMQDSIGEMAETMASMGAFSEAFGMDSLSIATLKGYFATEIGTIHGLGSGMFAAILAAVMLSKEEDGHTGEFLYTLPVSRVEVITGKLIVVVLCLMAFTLVCGLFYVLGFLFLGEQLPVKDFGLYLLLQFLMNVEIGAICFAFSAFTKKNKLGAGLGLALVLYAYDLMVRVIPSMKDAKFISPYSYANATDVFSGAGVDAGALILGGVVIVGCTGLAYWRYTTRDLAS